MVRTTSTNFNSKAYRASPKAPGAPAKKLTLNSLEREELKEIVERSSDYGLYLGFTDLISQNIRERWEITAQISEENSQKEDPNTGFVDFFLQDEYPANPCYESNITDAPKKTGKRCSPVYVQNDNVVRNIVFYGQIPSTPLNQSIQFDANKLCMAPGRNPYRRNSKQRGSVLNFDDI